VDSLKTAVALCAQESGGSLDNCDAGAAGSGIPATTAFTPTKEVASLTSITNGVIRITLASGIGANVDGKWLEFTPTVSETSTSLTWATTAENGMRAVALAALQKNNVSSSTTSGGTTSGGTTSGGTTSGGTTTGG